MKQKEEKEFIACMAKNPEIDCDFISDAIEVCEENSGKAEVWKLMDKKNTGACVGMMFWPSFEGPGPTALEKAIYKMYKKNKDVAKLMEMFETFEERKYANKMRLKYCDINEELQSDKIQRLDNEPAATDPDYATKIKWWERQCKYDALIAEDAAKIAEIEELVAKIVKHKLDALEQSIKAKYSCEVAQTAREN